MNISVIISLYNEEESLPELTNWIYEVMNKNNLSHEIIMIDDGSNDNSWEIIKELSLKNKNIKGIKFRRNYGKSAALHVGFRQAKGNVVITMDADLQDNPEEIPDMYNMIIKEDYDLVSGWKKKRHDPVISKNIPSKFYNATARLVSGIKLHDFNCGLKAYKLSVVKSIEIYGDMHRYIPIIAKQAGFCKIGEKVVKHQERKFGKTKFGLERFINGPLDLLSVMFISKFSKKPMHFFGIVGAISFFIGFAILSYLSFAKFVWMKTYMTDRPLFYLGFLSIIFGTQLFITGFIAELISRSSADRNTYLIEDKI